jgi:hypothetical protein
MIDFGQKKLAKSETTCSTCGMLYSIGHATDEATHHVYCRRVQIHRLPLNIMKEAICLEVFATGAGGVGASHQLTGRTGPSSSLDRIYQIPVSRILDDSLLKAYLMVVLDELGCNFEFITCVTGLSCYLYIDDKKEIMGCALIELVSCVEVHFL